MTLQPGHSLRTILLTALTMVCFASNSLLARLALRENEIDGATYTAVRIFAAALMLFLVVGARGRALATLRENGSWTGAAVFAGYAIVFSFAYVSLSAGVGALILFAAVQITMITVGVIRGERPRPPEWIGLALALGGLVYLVSPGLAAPSIYGAALMTLSGVAWACYSLAAKGIRSPIAETAGNFARGVPLGAAMLLVVWLVSQPRASWTGLALAVVSGAVTTGLGCAIWYTTLKELTTTQAAIVQLTVPLIAALAGAALLGEQLTWRLAISATVILGGVALALLGHRLAAPSASIGR
ncbi:MAG: DMT family transporter [Bryobacterales bacterium]